MNTSMRNDEPGLRSVNDGPLRLPAASALGKLRRLAAWTAREAGNLDPSCFALVMATGIVSNALFLQGHRPLADALFAVNLVAYPWLWVLTLFRAARAAAALWGDLISPHRVFLFFTAVAATDVLGTSLDMRGFAGIALAMWLAALALWLMLIYLGFGVFMLRNSAGRADVAEGAWLNAIVGTQSLVILGSILVRSGTNIGPLIVMLLHMLWTIGLVLYGIYVTLLAYRMFFSALEPDDVAPPLWVVMGAAAISVNAGSLLVSDGDGTPFLHAMQPFLDGVTLAMWAWATWWIPLLLLLGAWKHVVRRVPIDYTPMLWSIVFPLGMYSAATLRLSWLSDAPALASWSWIVIWVALAAWGATAIGLLVASWSSARTFLAQAAGAAR